MQSENLRAAQRGSAAAFEALMGEYEKRIYGLCLRMMGNVHDGEDAAQEAMIRIWQKIGQCRDAQALTTWIYRVTASVCTDAIRRRAKRAASSLEILQEDGFDPADEKASLYAKLDTKERMRLLKEGIQQLPTDMKTVLVLREIQGRSMEEIADILQLPQGTVKSRLSRAREKLCKILSKNAELFTSTSV